MRITQVEYRELVTLGNYSNVCIGATAEVGANDPPSGILQQLKEWVQVQLGAKSQERLQVHDAQQDLWSLQREKAEVERSLELAKERWYKAKEFLQRHGVDLSEPLPF